MPSSAVDHDNDDGKVRRELPAGGELPPRFVRALQHLDEQQASESGRAESGEWLGTTVATALPGIDVVAVLSLADGQLRAARRSPRHLGIAVDFPLTVTPADVRHLAAGAARPPGGLDAATTAALDRLRSQLRLRSLAVVPGSGETLLIVGSAVNRPLSRPEMAFLRAIAARLAATPAPPAEPAQPRVAFQPQDEFLNVLAHELRTPATTIRGGALLLLKRGAALSDEVRDQLLRDIAGEAERLHLMVEDLLTLTRSHGALALAPEPLRLHVAAGKVARDLGSRLGNHAIQIDLPARLPVVEADPLALEQILRHLLEHAARRSPGGRPVTVTASAGAEVVVTVHDHGPPISPEDQAAMFEPFHRPRSSTASGERGHGLGLAVCRRLVEAAGGRIWAPSEDGAGAAISFTLPIAPDQRE